jgi:hypothetical protein
LRTAVGPLARLTITATQQLGTKLGLAFAFHRQLGRARVAERIQLNTQCKDGLAAMRHVRLAPSLVNSPADVDAALAASLAPG